MGYFGSDGPQRKSRAAIGSMDPPYSRKNGSDNPGGYAVREETTTAGRPEMEE
jgi:hypothetical protein